MNENIKLLLEKLNEDESIVAKLKEIKDPDEAYALVSSVQGGFTKEEFIDAMMKLGNADSNELSDEEVAAAAGGLSTSDIIRKTKSIALTSAVSTSI
jgi:predicted ribosomally synthesized peptide with nif11-like leader